MCRIVERPAERGAGPLDEHLPQRRGHALGAEGALDGRHGARIAGGRTLWTWPATPPRLGSRTSPRIASCITSLSTPPQPTSSRLDGPAVEEVSGKPYLATLSDIWDDVREIWRQGMDVLRDPQIY